MAIFDSEAVKYDDWYRSSTGSFVDRMETELAFNLLSVEKGMKVLDFGCGTGNFSIKLAGMGCRVIGVDVSGEMLKIARSKMKESGMDVDFREIKEGRLPFAENSFDAVISMAVFEFIPEPLPAFQELLRAVKPGGAVLIGTINKDSAWGRLYESEYFRENTIFRYSHFKTFDDLKSWEPDKLAATGECLFIGPEEEDERFTFEVENELKGSKEGGFICALWRK